MTKIEEVTAALTAVKFEMPGAGGLRGQLHLAPAQARDMARAAIEAMREPTPAMLKATFEDEDGEVIWHAMIDAALKETNLGG